MLDSLTLDHQATSPLRQQLYEKLRQAILKGLLHPGQRIPSTRLLAKTLGISRATATQSYEQLLNEGYIETTVGSGTFVCTQLPHSFAESISIELNRLVTCLSPKLSNYGEQLVARGTIQPIDSLGSSISCSFHYGRTVFDGYSMQIWRKLLSHYCRNDATWLDYTTDVLSYSPLREAISNYLADSRNINCHPDQILITNGAQQALYLVTRLLINPGETIALEEPGYRAARFIFSSQGAKLLPISVDQKGLMVAELKQHVAEPVRLIYTTPAHQFPTGATLPLSRRLELLTWAQQTGTLIIEDDYDSEFRYGGRPIPALKGLDQNNLVLHIGTFSKVLFPALRIGYLVLPENLIPLFKQAKWLSDRQRPLLEQCVLADFIAKGYLESHIRRMRSNYEQRRQFLVQSFSQHLGEQITVLGENAGIHLMARLQTHLSDQEIIQRMAQAGMEMISAQPYYCNIPRSGEFIFGYAALTEQQIQKSVYKLAQLLKKEQQRI